MNDQPSGMPPAGPPGDATTKIPRPAADDFQPDVPPEVQVGTVSPAVPPPQPNADFAGDPTREPIAFDAPREPAMETAPPEDDTHLIPGASIAGGRYRLLVFHGGPPGLQFWQALDTALDRQVALTFVDPDRTLPAEQVQEILARTLKLSRLERPGIARVLDVANTGSGGLVVSEWIRGGSLKEVADTSPSPIGGARADPVAGRGRRRGPRGRRRAVHRPPQPGAGQHRRRCRTGISRDDAARHPRRRHPRNRGCAVRAAGRSLAAARDRACPAAWNPPTRTRRASRWSPAPSTARFPSRSRRPPPARFRPVVEFAVPQPF